MLPFSVEEANRDVCYDAEVLRNDVAVQGNPKKKLDYGSIICYHKAMNKRHQNTLNEVFKTPVPTTLEWRRIEALFKAVGALSIEGSGSRVRFALSNVVATFHRPHPQKEAKPYQVRDARRFLQQAGITP